MNNHTHTRAYAAVSVFDGYARKEPTMTVVTSNKESFYPSETFDPGEIVPDALILKIATVTKGIEGDIPSVRVPYVKTDPTSGFTDEGDDITPSDADLDEITVTTNKIAVLTKQSREAYAYGTSNDHLAASLERSVIVKANTALLSNASGPTGLLNVSGIVDGGTVTDNFDPISDAITGIECNGGTATSIVMDPKSWGVLCKLKTSSGTLQLGSPAEQTERRLFGLPVYVTPQMPAGNILIVDATTLIAAVSDISAETDSSFYFGSDSIAHRVTWRIGWNLVHPDRLAKVKVTVPEQAELKTMSADMERATETTEHEPIEPEHKTKAEQPTVIVNKATEPGDIDTGILD